MQFQCLRVAVLYLSLMLIAAIKKLSNRESSICIEFHYRSSKLVDELTIAPKGDVETQKFFIYPYFLVNISVCLRLLSSVTSSVAYHCTTDVLFARRCCTMLK